MLFYRRVFFTSSTRTLRLFLFVSYTIEKFLEILGFPVRFLRESRFPNVIFPKCLLLRIKNCRMYIIRETVIVENQNKLVQNKTVNASVTI